MCCTRCLLLLSLVGLRNLLLLIGIGSSYSVYSSNTWAFSGFGSDIFLRGLYSLSGLACYLSKVCQPPVHLVSTRLVMFFSGFCARFFKLSISKILRKRPVRSVSAIDGRSSLSNLDSSIRCSGLLWLTCQGLRVSPLLCLARPPRSCRE